MPNDLDKLQGIWNITFLEADGQHLARSALEGSQITISKNRFKSVGMGATYEGTVEVNEHSKPKSLDLLFTAGPEKGNRNLGIYKLSGDKWTLCLATRGSVRPREFASESGSGFALETLERGQAVQKSKKPKSKADAAPSGPPTEIEGEWAMVSAVFNGAPMEESAVKWCKRITRGDITSVVAGPQVFLKARFTLDRSKSPNFIDYVNLVGSSKGKPQAGIFELQDNVLRICVAAPENDRPSDFSSQPGDGRSYTVWRRST
jgi:uncharacterized protein (TIGR03067 family)